jgi:hypothetical protein
MKKILLYLYTLICIPSIFILNLLDSEEYQKNLKKDDRGLSWFIYLIPHVLIFWTLVITAIYLFNR